LENEGVKEAETKVCCLRGQTAGEEENYDVDKTNQSWIKGGSGAKPIVHKKQKSDTLGGKKKMGAHKHSRGKEDFEENSSQ